MIELKRSLASYGLQLIRPNADTEISESLPIELVEAPSEDGAQQLELEIERPPARLRVLRRHPSI